MKKAQVSVEYLFVILFFLGFLVLVGGLIFSLLNSSQAMLDDALAGQFATTLSESGSRAFFGGVGSKLTLDDINFPQGVDKLEVQQVENNYELVFTGGEQEFAFSLPVATRLMVSPQELSGGKKTVILETLVDRGVSGDEQTLFVAVSFGSVCPARSIDTLASLSLNNCQAAGKYATSQLGADYSNAWWENSCWQIDTNGDCKITMADCVMGRCDDSVNCEGSTPYLVGTSCVECRVGMSDCNSDSFCNSGGVCRALVGVGDMCSDNDDCVSGAFCNRGNQCESLRAVGGTCTLNAECGSGACENGVCRELLSVVGGACTGDVECLSGVCDTSAGVCGYQIVTLVGTGAECSPSSAACGDGGPATSAKLDLPQGVAVSTSGEVFIADTNNDRVRKVDVNGIISTIAGNGTFGFSGDGGPATNAKLNRPRGLAVSDSGEVFIADTNNERVRKVDVDGMITSVVISNLIGSVLTGLALSGDDLFLVENANHQLLKATLTNGGGSYVISTVAGTGVAGYSGDGGSATDAQLRFPFGVVVDDKGTSSVADDDVIFSEPANDVVRRVNVGSGVISRFAGAGRTDDDMTIRCPLSTASCGDGGLAVDALLNRPSGLAVSADGELFIADRENHRVRKIDVNGVITTIAGSGVGGFGGDGGLATAAQLNRPRGLAVSDSGDIFIADTSNNRIRKLCVNASNC